MAIIACTIDFCGALMYLGQGSITSGDLQRSLYGKPLSDLVS